MERGQKGVINVERELQHSGSDMNNTEGMMTQKGAERKMEKGVDKSLRGRYNSKAVGRERQASETEVRAEGCERK